MLPHELSVDEQTEHAKIDFDEGKLVPGARGWIKKKINKPSYEAAESLLYFLDKYTTIVVGGSRAMGKYYKNNRGKTLLDKLTVSDIAYSLLVYENAFDVWSEEIVKTKMCTTNEEKKNFKMTAVNKYHVKRGTRLPVYQDGWTNEGQEYFKDLCVEIQALKNNNELWGTLKVHWATYVKKYHKYSYVASDMENGTEVMGDKENEVDDDNDCIVSLPGEIEETGMDDEEFGYNSESYESESNDEADKSDENICTAPEVVVNTRNQRKRQRVYGV